MASIPFLVWHARASMHSALQWKQMAHDGTGRRDVCLHNAETMRVRARFLLARARDEREIIERRKAEELEQAA